MEIGEKVIPGNYFGIDNMIQIIDDGSKYSVIGETITKEGDLLHRCTWKLKPGVTHEMVAPFLDK